ncbi:DsbA family oxidoreductase [Halostreptopolyspora alba]|uniref:DsbA family oxidoreductase n=1 Tax=Halostreptopolyspora alba TaxID=2487137 RepID=A0A3N0E8I7_9ACTN|nr:DsbA family oxidoreductase [Nocardiopsaceae bacterium YIM 96095]
MSPPEITVYFDYVCPYCLLAEDTIATVAAERGATIAWRPFELRPEPTATLRPEDDYLPRVWRASVYPMAERLGVAITLPTVSPQPHTHLAFEGALYAREHGRAEPYHDAVLRAFFQRDRDIGQPAVLTDIAAEVGLDTTEFATVLAERRNAEDHRAELALARQAGVRAVPTVDIGTHRFEGVPEPERLREALSEVPEATGPTP